jgi:CPA1 family monovalent cation:H+ antiporter
MIGAERGRILEIRKSGTVASEVIAEVLAMLDVEESMIDVASAAREELKVVSSSRQRVGDICAELERYLVIDTDRDPSCARCIDAGVAWVALRQCLECGNVACCDSSPLQHATAHFHETTHPVMQSAEPGEDWRWCYVHHLTA